MSDENINENNDRDSGDSGDEIDLYIKFIQTEIQKYIGYSKFRTSSDITLGQIRIALYEYTEIALALHMEYERIRIEYGVLTDQYKKWLDEIFLKAKEKLNPLTLASGKWSSIREIETQARVDNSSIYKVWQSKLRVLRSKLRFYRRLIGEWKNHKDILTTLSYNRTVEIKAYGAEKEADIPIR